jgi:endonuclease/exonuclease/phosphatase (EEP) superfamily protein YafD
MLAADLTMPGRRHRTSLVVLMSVVVVGSLLASLLLALAYVTDPTQRRLIELATLTPWGLPAAAVALVVAAAWPGSRRTRAAGVLAATCLVAVHAWWLAPLYVGQQPAGGPASLVVLAQNFEYGDPTALVDLVRREAVDVLVLTDAGNGRTDVLLEAGIERWLPYAAGLGEEGAVVLSRVPVTGTALLFEEAESRRVEVRAPGLGVVTVVAVHTRPPYAADDWRSDHEQIHAALEGATDPDSAVVLAGDFNATLAHAPMRRLLDLGFTDAAVQANAGLSPTWPAGGHQSRLGITVPAFAAIDHVLTSSRLVVTEVETLALPGADHEAVLATISGAG